MEADMDWAYDFVVQTIRSPEFRNPLKDFIDDNCGTFIGVDENTFEQGSLHKEFVTLVDNLLETITKDIGITEEMFCLAAKKGLENPETKKYFEQLISFTNYNYFKNLMTKRNLQLEKLAYERMMEVSQKEKGGEEEEEGGEEEQVNEEERKVLEAKRKQMEDDELQCAIKMSLAVEEEKKKLQDIEDNDLKKAIELSLAEQNQAPEKEKTAFVKAQPEPLKMTKPKAEVPKMEEIEMPKEAKMNPIDKVALKKKLLQEHDEKVRLGIGQKLMPLPALTPTFTSDNNNPLNSKLNEIEESKAKKLQEYREMILKMKKEKRQKHENEVDDVLGGEAEPKLSEEEKKKMELRKELAEKLKARLASKK